MRSPHPRMYENLVYQLRWGSIGVKEGQTKWNQNESKPFPGKATDPIGIQLRLSWQNNGSTITSSNPFLSLQSRFLLFFVYVHAITASHIGRISQYFKKPTPFLEPIDLDDGLWVLSPRNNNGVLYINTPSKKKSPSTWSSWSEEVIFTQGCNPIP